MFYMYFKHVNGFILYNQGFSLKVLARCSIFIIQNGNHNLHCWQQLLHKQLLSVSNISLSKTLQLLLAPFPLSLTSSHVLDPRSTSVPAKYFVKAWVLSIFSLVYTDISLRLDNDFRAELGRFEHVFQKFWNL